MLLELPLTPDVPSGGRADAQAPPWPSTGMLEDDPDPDEVAALVRKLVEYNIDKVGRLRRPSPSDLPS